jgi:hypothetical protein
MFLLVGGTIAQRYIGLYQSEKLFFGSFIFWLGPLPLPGAYSTLGLIALCLIAKLVLKSPWRKAQAGIIVTHISALVLLAGALVTTLCREEGYILLGPDESSNIISDYQLRELAILKNGTLLLAVPQAKLQKDAVISTPALPFSLHVYAYFPHCVAVARAHPSAELKGAAQKVDIVHAPPRKENEENQSGVIFEVSGLSAAQNGTYITSEALSQPPVIKQGKDTYTIIMRPEERLLPFTVHLLHFDKTDYPGTDKARSYRSEIEVKDGTLAWNTSIEMNQPLRHQGYTLYQSSFAQKDGTLYTVLAVVKNAGAYFPYIAIATLCAGLLLHLGIRFTGKNV